MKKQTISGPINHLGLKTVHKPSGSLGATINVIFVHGLGGSAKRTWGDSTQGLFWPLWLPYVKGLENVRIMTFDYDSSWAKIWKERNVLDISDFAKQLVHEVWCYSSDFGDVK